MDSPPVFVRFTSDGRKRATQAERRLEELRDRADSVITIPNPRPLGTIDRKPPPN